MLNSLKRTKDKFFPKKPIYFVTFHKTASSYFSGYILGEVEGLKHYDIASYIFQNNITEPIDLEHNNSIYGPIRLSLDEGPVYERLVLPILKQGLLKKYRVIFFIRDPRDIIVSYYYSQAYSHVISDQEDIKVLQLKNRDDALKLGIDNYALEKADFMAEKFNIIIDLLQQNSNSIVLKYEDMIYDFDNFFDSINNFITLPEQSKQIIYDNTRPKNKGIHHHRRSGTKESYKNELKKETIEIIDEKLKTILKYFNY